MRIFALICAALAVVLSLWAAFAIVDTAILNRTDREALMGAFFLLCLATPYVGHSRHYRRPCGGYAVYLCLVVSNVRRFRLPSVTPELRARRECYRVSLKDSWR
jgi:hypothetical protein